PVPELWSAALAGETLSHRSETLNVAVERGRVLRHPVRPFAHQIDVRSHLFLVLPAQRPKFAARPGCGGCNEPISQVCRRNRFRWFSFERPEGHGLPPPDAW